MKHAHSFPVVLNKFKVCPELMIRKKGYDKNGLVTCTSNTLCNCSVGTFTSLLYFRQQMNGMQCNCKSRSFTKIVSLQQCCDTVQALCNKCTVLCKQSCIFIWAKRLTVEVMYVCMYAEEIERWPFTLYEMKRKQSNLFCCTKHLPCLHRMDGRF